MILTKKIHAFSVSVMASVLLSACGGENVNYADVNQTSTTPATLQTIEWSEDAAKDFAKYQASAGHKAFAIGVTEGIVMSTGIAADKISIEYAEQEALNLCQFADIGDSTCFILERDSTSMSIELSQSVVSSAPKELTSFRDIQNYYEFVNASAPKVFAVSPVTGTSFWATGGLYLGNLEEYALQSCNDMLQDGEPNCAVLYSQ